MISLCTPGHENERRRLRGLDFVKDIDAKHNTPLQVVVSTKKIILVLSPKTRTLPEWRNKPRDKTEEGLAGGRNRRTAEGSVSFRWGCATDHPFAKCPFGKHPYRPPSELARPPKRLRTTVGGAGGFDQTERDPISDATLMGRMFAITASR